jgi:hypothetical protein
MKLLNSPETDCQRKKNLLRLNWGASHRFCPSLHPLFLSESPPNAAFKETGLAFAIVVFCTIPRRRIQSFRLSLAGVQPAAKKMKIVLNTTREVINSLY